MGLPFNIARRYLFARKSHNVINVISAISAAGMAVGTAALILILSVYNGFDGIVRDNLSDLDPDILVRAAEGKFFNVDSPVLDVLDNDPGISSVSCVLGDNVFVEYGGRQAVASVRGVDAVYEQVTALHGHLTEGEFSLNEGEIPLCSMGAGLSYSLGAHTWFVDPLVIHYPKRGAAISTLNPASSLNSVKVWPGSVFSINSTVDEDRVIISYGKALELFGLEDGTASEIEIRLKEGESAGKFAARLDLGDDFEVLDRYQQHPSVYRMMKYEKLAVYLILLFVVIIVAFNIFGSMSMLVIEKKDDIESFRTMGATAGFTRKVFVLEGWLISLSGLVAGLVVGVLLAWIQQRFGVVKLPAGYLVQAYPVVLQASDVLWTAAGVAAVGFVISLLSVPKFK